MRFDVPSSMIERLRERWGRDLDDIEREHDAVVLDGGLGPALYLTRDGRVLVDGTAWDDSGVREASRTECFTAIIIGAQKTQDSTLLGLLPARPLGASDCQGCATTGWLDSGDQARFVCHACGGVGWLPASPV